MAPADVAPAWTGSATLEANDRTLSFQVVEALEPAAIGEIYAAAEGRLPGADGEAAISPHVADRLGLGVGDTLAVGADDLQVVGVLAEGRRPYAQLLTLPGAPHLAPSGWFVLGENPVTWDDVVALNGLGAEVTSRDVATNPPADGDAAFRERFGPPTTVAASTIGIGAAVAAIVGIEAVLLVGPAFAVGARRSTRTLALVGAAGGSPRDTRRIVLSTGIVAGLVAGVVGVLVGIAAITVVWFARRDDPYPLQAFLVPWWLPPAAVVFAVALAALSSWMPARSAARLDVPAALAGRRADASPRRRTPWIGIALAVLGLAGAAVGTAIRSTGLLVSGIVVLELGVVLAAGGIVSLVARLAPRLGVAGRFAVRDAVRQRSRTTPAVASVLAATAALVAAGSYVSTEEAVQEAAWRPAVGVGTAIVRMPFLPADEGAQVDPAEAEAVMAAAVDRVEQVVPVAGSATVHVLGVVGAVERVPPWATAELRPDRACPADETTTQAEWEALMDDPRCQGGPGTTSTWWAPGATSVIVDDGTALAQFGLGDEGRAAAEALAEGRIVVGHEGLVWDDGTAHVSVQISDPEDPQALPTEVVLVGPAHVQDFDPLHEAIVPTSLVATAPELTAVVAGGVVRVDAPYDRGWADRVTGSAGAGSLEVQEPYRGRSQILLLLLVAVAAVVTLGATWLSVGLAAAETRADLATLAAVGAPARVRRSVAGAQAAVIAVTGVGLGVVLGLLLGWILARWTLTDPYGWAAGRALAYGVQVPVTVPWLWVAGIAVVVPVLAVAGAWLTAPSRLPLVRRLAQ
ncbi:FtsX-like permease family protein [Serinibacter arcticus]|uniref:FtsX-like permease family protein n=1 Tax=Serinibacter arcticus TaxID=1655435 RepID=UPI0013049BA1|nr:FtsX-like permease family protein [Serinibacter arcticus]